MKRIICLLLKHRWEPQKLIPVRITGSLYQVTMKIERCDRCEKRRMVPLRRRQKKRLGEFVEEPISQSVAIGLEPGAKRFWLDDLHVLVGRSPQGWHLSISHKSRYPTWDEIAHARYELIPNEVTMAMLLPPTEEYVNLHQNTFHLWEVEDDRMRGRVAKIK